MISAEGSTSLGRAVRRYTIQLGVRGCDRFYETLYETRCLPWTTHPYLGLSVRSVHSMLPPLGVAPGALDHALLDGCPSRSRDLWPTRRHITV